MTEKPKIETELDFLAELERGDVTSQLSLSKRISVSVGFVNALLKRAVQKGFVKVNAAPRKRYAYYVTPRGFREKSRLVSEYLESSLHFFRKVREEYRLLFVQTIQTSETKFILAGLGELAEIALLAADEANSQVVGIYDASAQSDRSLGLPIYQTVDELPIDAVLVITESKEPQAAFELLRQLAPERLILTPGFLHVARQFLEQDEAAE